jgi:hypothetical protein
MSTNEPELPTEFRAAVDSAAAQCEAIVERFVSAIEGCPSPDVIYHYTDAAGLFGILTGGQLRLTDIFGLNDPSELRHGIQLGISALSDAAQNAHPAAKVFARIFQEIMSGNVQAIAHFFVGCFSENGDELGQWRAYGDDGRGFAIGFKGQVL